MRTIAKKIPAQPFASNTEAKQSYRVIGTVDINHKGTEHPLADVDPFIFLDETIMRGDEPWPFPKHPHYGLVAMTYMLAGEMTPWDNKQGKNKNNNRAGGIYYINAGHGILHEEEPVISGGRLHWLQLWLNPNIYSDLLPDAFTIMKSPEEIPVYKSPESLVRIVIGSAFQLTSPLTSDWPIQYLHVQLQPDQTIELPLPEADWNGFIYVLNGTGEFGANKISAAKRDCLVLGNEISTKIAVINDSQSDVLEFVFLCGKPHLKPFYKILGSGGALIATSEEAARNAMHVYDNELNNFGN